MSYRCRTRGALVGLRATTGATLEASHLRRLQGRGRRSRLVAVNRPQDVRRDRRVLHRARAADRTRRLLRDREQPVDVSGRGGGRPVKHNGIDLTGQRFSLLIVVGRADSYRHPDGRCGEARWLCRCHCGAESIVAGSRLRRGTTRSCGCRRALAPLDRITHGMSREPEYRSWRAMHQRCSEPRRINWAYYGGRGIRVCSRWASFRTFLEDVGRKPSPAHSLDRIDNAGHYEPGNVRWATPSEQARNRRPRSTA
jgi:hypothetical protein